MTTLMKVVRIGCYFSGLCAFGSIISNMVARVFHGAGLGMEFFGFNLLASFAFPFVCLGIGRALTLLERIAAEKTG